MKGKTMKVILMALCLLVVLSVIMLGIVSLSTAQAQDYGIDIQVPGIEGISNPPQPVIEFSAMNPRWESYAAYMARVLTVTMAFKNSGEALAELELSGVVCTSGVQPVDAYPADLGQVDVGETKFVNPNFYIPQGVQSFRASVYIKVTTLGYFVTYLPEPMP